MSLAALLCPPAAVAHTFVIQAQEVAVIANIAIKTNSHAVIMTVSKDK